MAHKYVGLVKDGDTVIVELAASVDQLNCELYRYLGLREITAAKLRARKADTLAAINEQFGKAFTRLVVREIASRDFSAGHVDPRF